MFYGKHCHNKPFWEPLEGYKTGTGHEMILQIKARITLVQHPVPQEATRRSLCQAWRPQLNPVIFPIHTHTTSSEMRGSIGLLQGFPKCGCHEPMWCCPEWHSRHFWNPVPGCTRPLTWNLWLVASMDLRMASKSPQKLLLVFGDNLSCRLYTVLNGHPCNCASQH